MERLAICIATVGKIKDRKRRRKGERKQEMMKKETDGRKQQMRETEGKCMKTEGNIK